MLVLGCGVWGFGGGGGTEGAAKMACMDCLPSYPPETRCQLWSLRVCLLRGVCAPRASRASRNGHAYCLRVVCGKQVRRV